MSDMPSTDDPRITVRLSQADYDHLKARAKGRGISLGALVREAVTGREPAKTIAQVDPILKEPPMAWPSCPIPSCGFSAPSNKAVCPEHGRKVVSGSRS